MVFALHLIVMSSAFFNPSFSFSSHFDTGKSQTEREMKGLVSGIAACLLFSIKLQTDCTFIYIYYLYLCL